MPKYDISIRNDEICIINNEDCSIFCGNYDTDPQMKDFCDSLALSTNLRQLDSSYSNEAKFQFKTQIISLGQDDQKNIIIRVPKNPFLQDFTVQEVNFQFSPGQHIYYQDSNPEEILFGDGKTATTVVKHHKKGWIGKQRYEYYSLNPASQFLYNKMISKSYHLSLYFYLQKVEQLYKTGSASFAEEDDPDYIQTAKNLAQQYKEITRKSILRPKSYELMHPDDIANSPIATSPEQFVPQDVLRYLITTQSELTRSNG